jgi:hypothetical protein
VAKAVAPPSAAKLTRRDKEQNQVVFAIKIHNKMQKENDKKL